MQIYLVLMKLAVSVAEPTNLDEYGRREDVVGKIVNTIQGLSGINFISMLFLVAQYQLSPHSWLE